MATIKELIVVEGKHDADRLHALYDCDVVCTDGLAMNEGTMELIRQASVSRGIIIMTDADRPGRIIQDKLLETVPEAKIATVEKKDSIGARNVGIEYAGDEAIRKALDNLITFGEDKQSLSWDEYTETGIMGNRELRVKICSHFHVGLCNNKTLFKRLNMLGVKYKEVMEAVNER